MIRTPGKFEGELYATRAVWEMSMDGMLTDIGSTDELGWFACYSGTIRGRGPFPVIISENSQGFVSGQYFDTEQELDAVWANIESEYEEHWEERGEE